MKKAYKLDDSVIAEVARLLQVALLTGTDIVDNLRTISVEREGDFVKLHKNYIETQKVNIEKMLKEAEELSQQDNIEIYNSDKGGFFN